MILLISVVLGSMGIRSAEARVVIGNKMSISEQMDSLYKEIAVDMNISYKFVKIVHIIAGGRAIYSGINPDIRLDTTAKNFKGPFEITGLDIEVDKKMERYSNIQIDIDRPSKYYMPDAAYSVMYKIVSLMNKHYEKDRGAIQSYFNSVNTEVKNRIIFAEAVLEYIGCSSESIDRYFECYERILNEKQANENVVYINDSGEYCIKDKYVSIYKEAGVTGIRELTAIAIILSYDGTVAEHDNAVFIKDSYTIPYRLGEYSRINAMTAAASLICNVRYVWGGGHGLTGAIEGINPVWEVMMEAYPLDKENGRIKSRTYCIKPTTSWCPIHGEKHNSNGCLFDSNVVRSVSEYLGEREGILNVSGIRDIRFENLLSTGLDITKGINSHRLDGLDCSGFVSWVYNQIDNKRNYDSSARNFIKSAGMEVVEYGEKVYPGDVLAWHGHIVMIVGAVDSSNRAYVIVESTPNMVKFGAAWFSNASSSARNRAYNIAVEANKLYGNIPEGELVHSFNIDKLGFISTSSSATATQKSTVTPTTTKRLETIKLPVVNTDDIYEDSDEDVEKVDETAVDKEDITSYDVKKGRYIEFGRSKREFSDELIEGKNIIDMYADEILQYIAERMPDKYLRGLDEYSGEIFDKYKIKETQVIIYGLIDGK